MTIKPRKRLKREKPDELAVPEAPNEVWSIPARQAMLASTIGDFMVDRLGVGRPFRLVNVLDDFNREGVAIASQRLIFPTSYVLCRKFPAA